VFALSGDQALSQITDLSWAPGQHQLLAVASDQGGASGGRSRLVALSDSAAPREVIALPAMVIPGSETWSPDGRQVAFLAKSGSATSLCLLNLADGGFRYLADTGGTTDPLPVAEVAWSADNSRTLFTAEEAGQNVAALWPFGGSPAAKLYATPPGGGPTHELSAALRSPVSLPDGTLLGFGRGKGGNVYLESLAEGRAPEPVSSTGLPRERFAARWDVARHQALLVTSGSASDGSERIEMWLVRFTHGGQA
jgi:WD40 repeat protein